MNGIEWYSAVEILIFWIGIYGILRFLKGTRGLGVLKGTVGFLLMLYVVSEVLDRYFNVQLARLDFIVGEVVTVALIAFVIIFQPELRRGLIRLGEKPFSWLSSREATRSVSPIAEAAGRMSRRRIGALVVIERTVGISGIVESGVPLSAEVTSPLLESIFYPNAPLHDGAVVVRGDRVVAACCFLPLSDNPNLGPEVGTRHRAAVGVSEDTDAVVVVVSEQTGRISVAYHGVLETVRDTRALESTINDIFDGGELEGYAELAAAATEDKDKEPEKDAVPSTIEEAKTTLIVKRASTRRKKPAGESTPDEGDKGFGSARAREA
jgi:diadenylate cyclase